MRKKVLVLGGNFAGLHVALGVRHELDGDVDVTVVSESDRFLFTPSTVPTAPTRSPRWPMPCGRGRGGAATSMIPARS
ncbi:hypothetical protein [Nonomuraea zeae]|uniref:FAD/NAD(P)-binding domain-containing protein n=1 Tax=Nonomuraea zeae TaxID=1642303 RepID=A0A5S4GS76_9ACTN|nr:hypothetical protein [Nonomuraea zeae]TMR35763.1 hypothetical protein ETD85_12715 [Nonomuraea zeae]